MIIFLVTKDVIKKKQQEKGLKPTDLDVVEVLKPGGLSAPKSVGDPEAGLLVFSTVGGVPYLQVDMIYNQNKVTFPRSNCKSGV